MSRILIYTSPAMGHLQPAMGLAHELKARGHQILIQCLATQVDKISNQGIEARAIAPQIEAIIMDDYLAKTPIGAVKRAIATFARRAPLEVSDLQSAMTSFQADALIIDTNCYGARCVAAASALPWLVFQPFLSPLAGKGVPPFGPGLPLRRGLIGRARDALLGGLINNMLTKLSLQCVNPIRRELGISELSSYREFTIEPPRTLYFTSEQFDYPRNDWPDSYVFCGPVNAVSKQPPPSWLESENRDIVLVTCSTEAQRDGDIIQTTLSALANSELFVIATSAAHDPSSFSTGPNARVERFLPHDAILQKAAAVVCHGGMGITQKALQAGVPVCVIPYGRDQLEVARRVEHAQAGVFLKPGQLTADRLRAAIELTCQRRAGAARIAQSFVQAGGASKACDAIDELMQSR